MPPTFRRFKTLQRSPFSPLLVRAEPKRVLVTGSTGFLGGLLMARLAREFEVVGLSCDIRDEAATRNAVAQAAPDVIIHCAALSRIGACEARPHDCMAINVGGSENVARAAAAAGVGTVIALSSDRVFQADTNVYGSSKAAMERRFKELSSNGSGTALVTMRLGKIPGAPGGFLDHWRTAFERDGVIVSTGPEQRSFFLQRDEFVAHVRQLVRHAQDWSGRIYVPAMKAARMRDLLEVWTANLGGAWRAPAGASPAPESGILISAAERVHTERILEGGLTFDLIGQEVVRAPSYRKALTVNSAEQLSKEELLNLLLALGIGELVPGERVYA